MIWLLIDSYLNIRIRKIKYWFQKPIFEYSNFLSNFRIHICLNFCLNIEFYTSLKVYLQKLIFLLGIGMSTDLFGLLCTSMLFWGFKAIRHAAKTCVLARARILSINLPIFILTIIYVHKKSVIIGDATSR